MATSPDRPIAGLVEAKMLEAYAAKLDELHDIIDRAADALSLASFATLAAASQELHRRGEFDLCMWVEGAIEAMTMARSVLAEADPEDLETPGGHGGEGA